MLPAARHAVCLTLLAVATIGLAEFRVTLSASTTSNPMGQLQGPAPPSRRQYRQAAQTETSSRTPSSHSCSRLPHTVQFHARMKTFRSWSSHQATIRSSAPIASTSSGICLAAHVLRTRRAARSAQPSLPPLACTSVTLQHTVASDRDVLRSSREIGLGSCC
jgi:hypothetical protein